MALFAEMRRRNVLKVALLYIIAAWLILWFVLNTSEVLGLPLWADMAAGIALLVGFPIALLFAWTYEITPAGLRKAVDVEQTQSIVYKTGQKLNAAVAVLIVLGVLAFLGEGLLPKFEFLVPGIPEGDAPVLETTPPEIRSLVLDNGLKIVVWPDHDIPNVALYVYVRAGGRNGYPGTTGLAHFFEHMMFLGTENLEPGEFDRVMEAAGGSNNAGTSKDMTRYEDWFPRSALETIVELEADRLQNLQIYEEAVEAERQVVLSERGFTTDDDNARTLSEQMYAAAYIAHPYQFPIIGWRSDIESWTVEDLRNFYRSYYAPNNLTMVFAGDVTPAEIFELSEKHFAAIPAQEMPPVVRTIEPEQQGTRRIEIAAPAQTPLLHMAFHAGDATDPVTAPLNLLLNILVGGESSRLHRILVEDERIALNVSAYQGAGFDPGLAYFSLTLPPGGDPVLVERRVLEELQRIVDEGVTEAELRKAQNIVLADFWRGLATIDGKALLLGRHELFLGDYESMFALPGQTEAISIADIQAAAAATFRTDRMTVGVLQEKAE
jgi:zinc protease